MLQPEFASRATLYEGRKAERIDLTIGAAVREPGSGNFSILIKDLSVSGFRCDTSHPLNPGARVWVTMAGLAPLEAEVRWRDGFYYGFSFVRPLYPAVLDHIAKRMRG